MPVLQFDSLINEFAERSESILRDNLVGVYLHGSAVMGCFNPLKSDIDLIVVADRPLSDPYGSDSDAGLERPEMDADEDDGFSGYDNLPDVDELIRGVE